MTLKNIYIRSLEIGFESENDGISFDKLKSILTEEGYSFSDTIFKVWYYSNFEHEYRHLFIAGYSDPPDNSYDVPHPLSSDSIMKYIKYVELKENRVSTEKAMNHSFWALFFAGLSMFINVISLELVYKGNQCHQQQQSAKIDRQMESNIKANQSYHYNDSLYEIDQMTKQEIMTDTALYKSKTQIE